MNTIKRCCDCQKPLDSRNNALCKSCACKREKARRYRLTVMWKQIFRSFFKQSCAHCGATADPNYYRDSLEFHHVDPLTVSFRIKHFVYRKNFSMANYMLLRNELTKCIVLCHDCHVEEHRRMKREERRVA
jgi:hypothetical protein